MNRVCNGTFFWAPIERYKTYQTGFSFRRLGHAPGVGLGGTMGGWGVQKLFSQIQPDLVCELLT